MQFPDLANSSEWGFLMLRVVIGVIFIVHGWPKLKGNKQMAEMMSGKPNPGLANVIFVQGVVEVLGGLAVAVGLYTQIAVIPLLIIMIGAIGLKAARLKTGFSSQTTTGWEFDLLIFASLLVLLLAGPGELALQ